MYNFNYKKMNRFRRLLFCAAIAGVSSVSFAQSFDDSGIAAGFFDSSKEKTINFSEFHLPPLAVLFENAKSTPQVLSLQKAQEIAEAEVAKQKRHIFSYITGHASYSYGVSDVWGQSSSSYYTLQMMQFTGNEQSYWNVGVNLAVPVEDILDLGAAVKRKKLEVDQAIYQKDYQMLLYHFFYCLSLKINLQMFSRFYSFRSFLHLFIQFSGLHLLLEDLIMFFSFLYFDFHHFLLTILLVYILLLLEQVIPNFQLIFFLHLLLK